MPILPADFFVMPVAVEDSSSILATMCDTLPFRSAIFTPGIMPSTKNEKRTNQIRRFTDLCPYINTIFNNSSTVNVPLLKLI